MEEARPFDVTKCGGGEYYCTISINSARTVTCDRPRALDGFVNAAKPRDIGRKIAKKIVKKRYNLPFWDQHSLDGFGI